MPLTDERLHKLHDAEEKANRLFLEVEHRGYIAAGQTEKELSDKVHALAQEMFGIKKHWHKRIVRATGSMRCIWSIGNIKSADFTNNCSQGDDCEGKPC